MILASGRVWGLFRISSQRILTKRGKVYDEATGRKQVRVIDSIALRGSGPVDAGMDVGRATLRYDHAGLVSSYKGA